MREADVARLHKEIADLKKEIMKEPATKVSIANIVMTTQNTEYSYQFPEDVKGFRMQCRDGTAFRFAFEMDKVGTANPSPPYHTVLANGYIEIREVRIEELHLYVACGTANKTVELISWN